MVSDQHRSADSNGGFLVVGIGASSGGLDARGKLLAFRVAMPVTQAKDGMPGCARRYRRPTRQTPVSP